MYTNTILITIEYGINDGFIAKFSVSTMCFNRIVLDIKAIMMYYTLLIN